MPSNYKQFKPPAVIQLDCDGENALSSYYGTDRKKGTDEVFSTLSRFLDIFQKYKIKATLFVVGKDVEDDINRKIIIKAVEDGHELANHTYCHPSFFLNLKKSERVSQILMAQQVLQNRLGITAYGFRAPNFELDEELIEILSEIGFRYDSSMLPTFLSPVLRRVKKGINSFTNSSMTESGYLGRASFCFAPRHMFLPSKEVVWKENKNILRNSDIFEVPVITSPYLKIPCHASYAMAYPKALRYGITEWTLKWYEKIKYPLVYVFHLCDLCEPQFMHIPESRWYGKFEDRLRFVEWVCEQISSTFCCMTTLEMIETVNR